MVLTCASFQPLALSWGVPIRGGISIGRGVGLKQSDFYGPALVEAHDLESKVADYPRVVLSKELVAFIQYCSEESKGDLNSIMNRYAAETLLDYITEDHDGQIIIDFLCPTIAADIGSDSHSQKQIQNVRKADVFIRSERDRFAAARDKKIADGDETGGRACGKLAVRYQKLVSYFDSRMSKW